MSTPHAPPRATKVTQAGNIVKGAYAGRRVCAEITIWLVLDRHGSALHTTERLRQAVGKQLMDSAT
jgi:hypothetical protein